MKKQLPRPLRRAARHVARHTRPPRCPDCRTPRGRNSIYLDCSTCHAITDAVLSLHGRKVRIRV